MKVRTKVIIGGLLAIGECMLDMCERGFENGKELHEQLKPMIQMEQEYCRDGEVCPL